MKKVISLENLNLLILNEKIDGFMADNNLQPAEERAHLMKVVLRHKVHHFPTHIPFIAAVKKCSNGSQVVFNLKRGKVSEIQDIDILNQTNVAGSSFKIDNVEYKQIDTINGWPRYKAKV